MPNRLYNLLSNEISLVPRGANGRRFTVVKEDKGDARPTKMSAEQKTRIDKVLKEMVATPRAPSGVTATPKGGATPPTPATPATPNLFTDAPQTPDPGMLGAMKSAARILSPYHDKLTMPLMMQIGEAIGISDAAGIDALATGNALAPPDKGEQTDPGDQGNDADGDLDNDESLESDSDLLDDLDIPKPEGVSDEHHAQATEKAKAAYTNDLKDKYQLTRKGDKPDGDAKEKATMPAEVKKEDQATDTSTQDLLKQVLEGQQALLASHKELSGRQEKIQKEFDDERADRKEREEKRVLKEYEDQALRDFKHLGVDAKKFASVSRVLKEHNPEAHKSMVEILKAADAQVGDGGMFESRGTTATSETASQSADDEPGGFASTSSNGVQKSDAEGQIDQIVRGMVQKDEGSTYEQKYTEFLNTPRGQKMYAQYEIEQQKMGHRTP